MDDLNIYSKENITAAKKQAQEADAKAAQFLAQAKAIEAQIAELEKQKDAAYIDYRQWVEASKTYSRHLAVIAFKPTPAQQRVIDYLSQEGTTVLKRGSWSTVSWQPYRDRNLDWRESAPREATMLALLEASVIEPSAEYTRDYKAYQLSERGKRFVKAVQK